MIAELKSDQNFAATFLRGLLKCIESFKRIGNWLFKQNGTASLSSGNRNIQMQGGWVRHNDCIRFMFFQRLVNISFNGIACKFIIGQRSFARAQEHNIFFAEREQIAKVSSADRTQTSDQELHANSL